MMPVNLQEIIRCVRNGDHTAFRNLVTMYRQQAYRLAFRILGNEEEARDAVQESFIRIWEKIGSFDPSREFVPWMCRIVINTATDRQRTIRRHTMVPIDQVLQKPGAIPGKDADSAADNHELALMVKGLAGLLPGKQKLVFILRDLEGMASQEVESITGLTETAVKTNLYHARKRVREQLLRILEQERRIQ
jgi:RNA polymerase sigma-70 factor, ECF subfamily